MKIAIFTDTYKPEVNGIVTSIDNFSKLLVKRGHEIIIFCPKYKGHADQKEQGIKVVRYPAMSFFSNKATKVALPSFYDLIRRIRSFKPDIIHIQTPSNVGIAGIVVSKAMRIKNVQTYHTYLPELAVYFDVANVFGLEKIGEAIDSSNFAQRFLDSSIGERLAAFSKKRGAEEDSLLSVIGAKKPIEKRNYKLTEAALWTYTRWIYNRADLVLTPSDVLGRILKDNDVKSPVKTQTNGIWIKDFKLKGNFKPTCRIIHYGRLGFEKRADIVLKAFALAQKTEPRLRLDIMGDGPAKASLEQLAAKLKIEDSVKFFGFVDRKKIARSLKNYDIFVTASPMETQGMVVLEAMAVGLPVVGVNKLAVPEIVKNNKTGFVVGNLKYKQMAEAILKFACDDHLLERIGKNGRALAETHDLNIAVEKLEAHYLSLIKRK